VSAGLILIPKRSFSITGYTSIHKMQKFPIGTPLPTTQLYTAVFVDTAVSRNLMPNSKLDLFIYILTLGLFILGQLLTEECYLPGRHATNQPTFRRNVLLSSSEYKTIEESGLDFRQGQEILLFSTESRVLLEHTQPLIHRAEGISFPEGTAAGAEYSLPSSTKIKNPSSYTFIPPYVFMVWCVIRHSDNVILPTLHSLSLSMYAVYLECLIVADCSEDYRTTRSGRKS
jgi:hypothetical protein